MSVAREYKRRGLPISVIVIDFFHWPKQGDWKFDPDYWPDPEAMVRELKEMGIELMVSIWPTVDKTSENYQEMLRKGLSGQNRSRYKDNDGFPGGYCLLRCNQSGSTGVCVANSQKELL